MTSSSTPNTVDTSSDRHPAFAVRLPLVVLSIVAVAAFLTACSGDDTSGSIAVCGNGEVEADEECDDGGTAAGDGCSPECTVETGLEEICDDGVDNDEDGVIDCLDPECATEPACEGGVCGDGDVDAGEECDDGDDNSDTEPDACRTDCTAPTCGDNVVDAGEECDGGEDCSATCVIEGEAMCGDGVLDAGEECDDGGDNSDTEPGACRTDCTAPACGDGIVDPDEGCDDGDENSDTEPGACRTDCTAPACGDGIVDPDEGCDDGDENSDTEPDACRTDCVLPFCGDGIVDAEEACDDGDDNSDRIPNACREDCTFPICGDGVADDDEQCDDGHDNGPDAVCSDDCVLDPERSCEESLLDLGELGFVDDGLWRYVGDFADADDDHAPIAGCTKPDSDGGVDVTFLFTSDVEATFEVSTNLGRTSSDTILYVKERCDTSAVIACNDDVPAPGALGSTLRFSADAGRPYFIVIDSFPGAASEFALEVRQIAGIAGPGEECSEEIACDEGLTCVALDGEPALCQEDAAPTLDDVTLTWRDAGSVRHTFTGSDPNRDVTTALFDTIESPGGSATDLEFPFDSVTWDGDDFTATVTLFGFDEFPATSMTARVRDASGNTSEALTRSYGSFTEPPTVERGATCDIERIDNRCAEPTTCTRSEDGEDTCGDPTAPTLDAFDAERTGPDLIRFTFDGSDPNGDVVAWSARFLASDGSLVGTDEFEFFDAIGRVEFGLASLISGLPATSAITEVEASLIDEAGLTSSTLSVTLPRPELRGLGETCDGIELGCVTELDCSPDGFGSATCEEPVPPTLSELEAFYVDESAGTLRFEIVGSDPNADVASAFVLIRGAAGVLGVISIDGEDMVPDVTGRVAFRAESPLLTLTGGGGLNLDVVLFDARDQASAQLTDSLLEESGEGGPCDGTTSVCDDRLPITCGAAGSCIPVVGMGESCDPSETENACVPGTVCEAGDEGATCVAVPGSCGMPIELVDAATFDEELGFWLLGSSTIGERDTVGASCAGGATSADRVFRYVAPRSGVLEAFLAASTDYDTALHVRRGTCNDPDAEIACNDDADSTLESALSVDVEEGDELFIIADGFGDGEEGDFFLSVGLLSEVGVGEVCDEINFFCPRGTSCTAGDGDESTCVAVSGSCREPIAAADVAEIDSDTMTWEIAGDTTDRSDVDEASCGGDGNDVVYEISPPLTGTMRATIDADFPPGFAPILSARNVACDADDAEFVCSPFDPDHALDPALGATLDLAVVEESTVYLVVDASTGFDGALPAGGAFDLTLEFFNNVGLDEACDGAALRCSAGTECIEETCQEPEVVGVGEDCSDATSFCEEGLRCVEDACGTVTSVGEGEDCASALVDCEEGYICDDSNRCAAIDGSCTNPFVLAELADETETDAVWTYTGFFAEEDADWGEADCTLGGDDQVFEFTPSSTGTIDVTLTSTELGGFDTGLFVRATSCSDAAAELACNDDFVAPDIRDTRISRVTLEIDDELVGEPLYIFVENPGEAGYFELMLEAYTLVGDDEECDGVTTRCDDRLICGAESAVCEPRAGTCAAPIDLDTADENEEDNIWSVSGSTEDMPSLELAGCTGFAEAPEFVFGFDVPTTGTLSLELVAAEDFDAALHVRTSPCVDPDAEILCQDAAALDTTGTIRVTGGETLYLIVDGDFSGSAGAFEMVATLRPLGSGGDECAEDADCDVGLFCETGDGRSVCTPADRSCAAPLDIEDAGTFDGETGEWTVVGDLLAGSAFVDASCSASAGVEIVHRLVAADDGVLFLDVDTPSTVLPTLHVRSGVCEGSRDEVACAAGDTVGDDASAGLTLEVSAGEELFVIVDSSLDPETTDLDAAPYTLRARFATVGGAGEECNDATAICEPALVCAEDGERFTCQRVAGSCSLPISVEDEGALVDGVWELEGDTTDALSLLDSTCGDVGSPELVYTFTAPTDGFVLAEVGTDPDTGFDAVLHVREADCRDPAALVTCNDDADAPDLPSDTDPRLEVEVAEGETYYIVVDGFDDEEFGTFELDVFFFTVSAEDEACDGVNALCDTELICVEEVCEPVTFIEEGASCDGPTLVCETPLVCGEDDSICRRPAGTSCDDPIDAATAGSDDGTTLTVSGSTYAEYESTHDGTCGIEETPESIVVWTSDVAGEVTFSLFNDGTLMDDTILSVRQATCSDADAELDCNDDFGGSLLSEVTVTVEADTTYYVLIEAFFDPGPWELTIERP